MELPPLPTFHPRTGKRPKLRKYAEKPEIRGLVPRSREQGWKLEEARLGSLNSGRSLASTRSCSTWQVARSMMRWMKIKRSPTRLVERKESEESVNRRFRGGFLDKDISMFWFALFIIGVCEWRGRLRAIPCNDNKGYWNIRGERWQFLVLIGPGIWRDYRYEIISEGRGNLKTCLDRIIR